MGLVHMIESEYPQPDIPLTAASIRDAVQAGKATVADVKKVLRHAVPVPTKFPESVPPPLRNLRHSTIGVFVRP